MPILVSNATYDEDGADTSYVPDSTVIVTDQGCGRGLCGAVTQMEMYGNFHTFKDMIAADSRNVFLNPEEFAELCTVQYDGSTYTDIPIVMSDVKEQDWSALVHDHAQVLYQVTSVLHRALSDTGGKWINQDRPIHK